jgi:signal transduction histidine kinase
MADSRFVKFAENLLTGHIGTASAKILIAGVTKEEKISLPEVLQILEESKENLLTNKKLVESSNELKKISAQLQIANNLLVEKDLQKDEFLDTVTHELRTPITAIRASSEILYDDAEIPLEIRQQFLQTIISESDRLNRLIDKILDLEKYESGKQIIQFQKHNIFETIAKALNPLQQLISKQNVFLDFKKESKPFFCTYDEEKIIQVLTNLVSNSIKFCDEKAGYIQIQIKKNNEILIVEVFNNGSHIPNQDLQAIFDKFYQSSNQNIKKPIGSGLGLAICKQIIEARGGQIQLIRWRCF